MGTYNIVREVLCLSRVLEKNRHKNMIRFPRDFCGETSMKKKGERHKEAGNVFRQ